MKHTKKQIQEAIKYWEKVLAQLNESKSPLLNAFIKEFGEDVVFDAKCNLILTNELASKIFQILDRSFFNNKLSKISNLKLFVGNANELNPIIQTEYVHSKEYDISNCLAVFQPDIDYAVVNRYLTITAKKYGIFINVEQSINLQYAIVTICHEMIHCLDFVTGTLRNQTEQMANKHYDTVTIDYASHFTPMFKQKRQQMKTQNNLTIPITGDDKAIEQLCAELAAEALLMKEADKTSDAIPQPFVASKEFQEIYKDSMTFDAEGHIIGAVIFRGHPFKH